VKNTSNCPKNAKPYKPFSAKKNKEGWVFEKDCAQKVEDIENNKIELESFRAHIETLEVQLDRRTDELQSLKHKNEALTEQLKQLPLLGHQLQETEQKLTVERDALSSAKKLRQDQEMAHRIEQRQNVTLIKQLQNQVKILQGLPPDAPLLSNSTSNPTLSESLPSPSPSKMTER